MISRDRETTKVVSKNPGGTMVEMTRGRAVKSATITPVKLKSNKKWAKKNSNVTK